MARKPNILLIHGDQHRYDCLGAYGNTEIQTPNIDILAQMFFDLERDPLELDNLFGQDERKDEIATLRDQLTGWPLFDNVSDNHLDYHAPRCKAKNVPDGDTGLIDHFRSIMKRNAEQSLGGDFGLRASRSTRSASRLPLV